MNWKLLALLPLLLVGCSSAPTEKSEVPSEYVPAVYCIVDAQFTDDDTVLLDMPGYPYGMDDEPMEISKETYNQLEVEFCPVYDPRMNSTGSK